MNPNLVDKDAYASLARYDALFIRETTAVNHHTFRFARRAEAEGLVVVDDPESILRCTNKVYLAELMERRGIPTPTTIALHRDNLGRVPQALGFPCVLKQPDSAFSRGVVKVEDEREFVEVAERLLSKSDLVVAQKFTPTDFDWRVGIFDSEPLWVCRYYMVQKHWQILESKGDGPLRYGRVQAVAVDEAPPRVVRTALRAAQAIGTGLYGVDLKEIGGRVYVVEVNDNPSIEAGYEDRLLGKELYLSIMRVFRRRLDRLHGRETEAAPAGRRERAARGRTS